MLHIEYGKQKTVTPVASACVWTSKFCSALLHVSETSPLPAYAYEHSTNCNSSTQPLQQLLRITHTTQPNHPHVHLMFLLLKACLLRIYCSAAGVRPTLLAHFSTLLGV
jgi:hypothetical protein